MNRRQMVAWGFFWIYSLNLLFVSIQHPDDLPSFMLMMDDKVLHAFQHFLLFFFALAAFRLADTAWLRTRAVFYSFLYCLLMGAAIEVEQLFVTYRHAEVLDWIADLFGTSIAFSAYKFLPFLRKPFTD